MYIYQQIIPKFCDHLIQNKFSLFETYITVHYILKLTAGPISLNSVKFLNFIFLDAITSREFEL